VIGFTQLGQRTVSGGDSGIFHLCPQKGHIISYSSSLSELFFSSGTIFIFLFVLFEKIFNGYFFGFCSLEGLIEDF
jgi:hypothetical protein